jgi:8-oxo-dGTP pyrophosphatase MutT (NUDIX family)
MEKQKKKKVVIYVIRNDKLLVFRHVDFSYKEVGIQVPSGTIKENEKPETAALRELIEETGYNCFQLVDPRPLGMDSYDITPNRFEIQERYFFLAVPTAELPERWNSEEKHDGTKTPTRFECFWIPITKGHILERGQGSMLYKIPEVTI